MTPDQGGGATYCTSISQVASLTVERVYYNLERHMEITTCSLTSPQLNLEHFGAELRDKHTHVLQSAIEL